MATLLRGKSLSDFFDHYAPIVNDSTKEEAYYCNLGRVSSWIDCFKAQPSLPGEIETSGNLILIPIFIQMTAALVGYEKY